MWLIVMFDLPTLELEDSRAYSKFRNSLLREGFEMIQYSVYARNNVDSGTPYLSKRVQNRVPKKGHVRLLNLTDHQYASMKILIDQKIQAPEISPTFYLF